MFLDMAMLVESQVSWSLFSVNKVNLVKSNSFVKCQI